MVDLGLLYRSDRLGEFGERGGYPPGGRRFCMNAYPAMITCAVLAVRSPRIDLNRCLRRL
jgi:hypothetical protein